MGEFVTASVPSSDTLVHPFASFALLYRLRLLQGLADFRSRMQEKIHWTTPDFLMTGLRYKDRSSRGWWVGGTASRPDGFGRCLFAMHGAIPFLAV